MSYMFMVNLGGILATPGKKTGCCWRSQDARFCWSNLPILLLCSPAWSWRFFVSHHPTPQNDQNDGSQTVLCISLIEIFVFHCDSFWDWSHHWHASFNKDKTKLAPSVIEDSLLASENIWGVPKMGVPRHHGFQYSNGRSWLGWSWMIGGTPVT